MTDRTRMTRLSILAAATAVLAAAPAAAQNTTQPPTVITVPQQTFDLQPNRPQATPTPTPTPTPMPSPAATAAPPPVTPTLPAGTPTAIPTASPTPRAVPPRQASGAPSPSPGPTAQPTATPAPATSAPAIVPTPIPTTTPVAAEPTPDTSYGRWPWLLAVLALSALTYFGWRRLKAVAEPDAEAYSAGPAPVPTPAPQPSPPAAMRTPGLAPATLAGPAVEFRPVSFRTQGPDAHVAFELTIANPTGRRIDGIRTLVALTSAGPDIAQQVAAFNASAPLSQASAPFDLAPGAVERLAGELLLPGDAMYVTEVGERALIVPVALINLRWRDGLSLRSRGESWMVGTGGADAAKLGPVRVDRGSVVHNRLAARRFDVPVA